MGSTQGVYPFAMRRPGVRIPSAPRLERRSERAGVSLSVANDVAISRRKPLSEPSGSLRPMADLTDIDQAVLELERSRWKYPGAKDARIHERFGWTATRYYQVLNRLLDDPAAMAADPLTVKRLRRLRDLRRAARSAERAG